MIVKFHFRVRGRDISEYTVLMAQGSQPLRQFRIQSKDDLSLHFHHLDCTQVEAREVAEFFVTWAKEQYERSKDAYLSRWGDLEYFGPLSLPNRIVYFASNGESVEMPL